MDVTPTPTWTPPTGDTPTETPTATVTEAPTETPTEAPTEMPTETPTEIPSQTPTMYPTPIITPLSVISLVPNMTVLGTGDTFEMNFAIDEPISGMGRLVAYVLVQTPQKAWLSFVYRSGAFVMEPGIKPAAIASSIPSITLPLLRQRITDSLTRGDYWFIAGIFHEGDRITLDNWKSVAIYSSEVTVTIRWTAEGNACFLHRAVHHHISIAPALSR